jgi:hypothetical protein
LHWAGAASGSLQDAVNSLVRGQNSDGGWSQLAHLPSDAYSTGEVLFAADPKTRSRSGFDALMVASGYDGAISTVQLLLSKGVAAEPMGVVPIFRSSAASQAARSGTLASLKLLAERAADLHRKVIDFWSFDNTFYAMAVMQGDLATSSISPKPCLPRREMTLCSRRSWQIGRLR